MDAAGAAAAAATAATAAAAAPTADGDTLVQYILVRKDLKWPAGAVAAQCCHGEAARRGRRRRRAPVAAAPRTTYYTRARDRRPPHPAPPPAAASMAAVWASRDDADTLAYLADVDNMHKVVTAALSEGDVRDTAARLAAAGVGHRLWVEQPEGTVTAVATKPARRRDVQPHFAAFKLYR